MPSRAGQAAVETVLAVLIVTSVFLVLFRLSHLLTGKILAEHAAMRVARARAVGLNDFICIKSARICVIPIAGKRIWPDSDDESFVDDKELARIHTYLETRDEALARGLLEYEGWKHLSVDSGNGGQSVVTLTVDGVRLEGRAGIENGASYYMGESTQ